MDIKTTVPASKLIAIINERIDAIVKNNDELQASIDRLESSVIERPNKDSELRAFRTSVLYNNEAIEDLKVKKALLEVHSEESNSLFLAGLVSIEFEL